MSKWEYQIVHFTVSADVAIRASTEAEATADGLLNQYGNEGWEVVSVIPGPPPQKLNMFVAFMKREKPTYPTT